MAFRLNLIPDAEEVDKQIYKQQAEDRILPKCGFRSAEEVRAALVRQNKAMNNNY